MFSDQPLSPLHIPELLDQVFSLIDRYTIATTVVLVCRQWFLLNQHRLYRTVAWDEDWKPDEPKRALERLPGAERFIFRALKSSPVRRGPNVQDALLALRQPLPQLKPPSLLRSILNPFFRDRHKKATPMTDALHQPLYEVVLMTSRTFGQSWINNLPFPSTLRRLTIEREASAYIDIGRILILCPLLESLHLLASWALYVTGPWTTGNQESLPNRLALRSLVLERPLMPQAWMEALLRKTPDLEDLKLITITDIDSNPWDWPRFFKHLQALALPLKQFHYSRPWTVPTSDEQEEKIFSVCSSAQDRTFLAQNLTPIIIKCLTDQPVALTTLDILLPRYGYCSRNGWLMEDEDISTGYTAQAWHQLLCECPNLRHLKTLKIPYMIEYMDLHRRNGMIPRYEDSHCEPRVQPIPGIWICRGLETLYLDLHVHDQNRRGIAYGYISRVCPLLRDLRISFPEGCSFDIGRTFVWQQPFVLQEGLCLLSRLKWLERLRVEYKLVECEFAELNWLCRSGRTEEHRARRREIVEGWTSRLEEEAIMEITRLAKSEGNEILGVGDGDSGLLVSMRNLGMLQDVKDMVVEMDTDKFVCLPELQQLACGNHLEQRPEKEIRSLFYSAPP